MHERVKFSFFSSSRPSQNPSSTPSSPQNPRRSLSSPSTNRRFQQSTSPPSSLKSQPPPLPCSDDSSTSSLQDTLECKSPPKPDRRTSRDGNNSSSDDESEEDAFNRQPSKRRMERRELILRDTVPSSWKYSPGIPRKEYQSLSGVTVNGHTKKASDCQLNSRLPSLTPRAENRLPPKVGGTEHTNVQSNLWKFYLSLRETTSRRHSDTLTDFCSRCGLFEYSEELK